MDDKLSTTTQLGRGFPPVLGALRYPLAVVAFVCVLVGTLSTIGAVLGDARERPKYVAFAVLSLAFAAFYVILYGIRWKGRPIADVGTVDGLEVEPSPAGKPADSRSWIFGTSPGVDAISGVAATLLNVVLVVVGVVYLCKWLSQ